MKPLSRMQRLWKQWNEQLWFKPAWWGVLATVVALMASVANRFVAEDLVPAIDQQTLQGLLTIIASSMLSVSTFSLSILVQAFSSAAGSASQPPPIASAICWLARFAAMPCLPRR